jgi:peptide deformylase
MIRPIVQTGARVLREPAAKYDPSLIGSSDFKTLIDDMFETMYDAPGVGLAAPQIGVGLQIVVIEDRPEILEEMDEEYVQERLREAVPPTVLVNPELQVIEQKKVAFHEGCLSVAGFSGLTPRHKRVRVRALNENGEKFQVEWEGWPARILQHEIDHLRGVLYIDHMDTRTFTDVTQYHGDGEDDDEIG